VGIVFLKDSERVYNKDKAVTIQLRDYNLERLYGVLFVFFELYEDYSYDIYRFSDYYLLKFKGWGVPKRGGI